MKLLASSLFLIAALGAIAAHAQDPSGAQGKVQHVIVVIQENRTPDNVFGSNPTFLTGANIAQQGLKKNSSPVTLTALPMYACYDLGHSNEDFQDMWDGGAMDGAYDEEVLPGTGCMPGSNPEYYYADNGTGTNPPKEVQPYFDIASNYGFANYMFQTNQGPSFPAHQFLFSGTSAPVYDDADGGSYWQWFAAENPGNGNQTGCFGATTNTVLQMSPSNGELLGWQNNYFTTLGPAGYTCYDHYTIADVLDPAHVTWKYYTNQVQSLWTAPNASQKICNATTAGGGCVAVTGVNTDWNNVIEESTNTSNPAQILQDISNTNCTALAKVSFVTPDGAWSDHAGCKYGGSCIGPALGPAWVAAIVDSVGQSSCGYWNNTVILITWDDWGGWYDHVSPPAIGYLANQQSAGSGGQYVYGFRVPLLVVSAYSPKPGYVSGPANSNAVTACPSFRYCHDFGSILNFIEWVFGSPGHSLGQIYGTYPYADHYALDGPTNCGTCTYSLADFFNFNNSATKFAYINPPVGSDGTVYDATHFINYTGAPQPPDED